MNESDIFIKLGQASLMKLELLIKHPKIFVFIEVANRESPNDIKIALEPINEQLMNSNYNKVFENINTSKFKEGLDIAKCINIIIWTIDGGEAREMKKEKLLPSRN